MSKKETTAGATAAAFPFFTMLGLIFITLKLCNVITWSWWYVLMPLYAPPAIILFIVAIVLSTAYALSRK